MIEKGRCKLVAEATVKLPTDFFNSHLIKALKYFDQNNELLIMLMKLIFHVAEKRKTRSRDYFALGKAQLTDEIIENVFDLKSFKGCDATKILENLGMITREETKIKVIPFWLETRTSPTDEYTFWRESVLKRDGYKCHNCGSTENIQAHHIVSWKNTKDNKGLRYDINNGVALCRQCHLKAHGGCWKNG